MAQTLFKLAGELNPPFPNEPAGYIVELTPGVNYDYPASAEVAMPPQGDEGPDLADPAINDPHYERPIGYRKRKHGVSI